MESKSIHFHRSFYDPSENGKEKTVDDSCSLIYYHSTIICNPYRSSTYLEVKRHFKTPLEKCVKVNFHVLLKKGMWKWKQDCWVSVRFFCPEMGNGNMDCGVLYPFK